MLFLLLESKSYNYVCVLGWVGYLTGFIISLTSNESHGVVVSAIGLTTVTVGAVRRPQRHIRLLDSLKSHRILGIILLTICVIGLGIKHIGSASISLGIAFFYYSYLSLKHREIYFNREQIVENHNPILYWFAAIFVWTFGFSLLLLHVWSAKFLFQLN